MLAAMALSPLAALSLPILQNEQWRESARQFGDSVRARIHETLDAEGFQRWAREMDDNLTFMDWTYKYTGVDMSYIWDPELWVKFKEAVWLDRPDLFWNKLAERIEYKSIIPQAGIVGDMRISYAKFLQLLEADRVKRVVVYGDMKTAVVEVPHPWYASIFSAPGAYPWLEDGNGNPLSLLVPDPAAPDDPLRWYCPEMPEWNMEKYRFYVDLPGDFWESGIMMRYLRSKEVKVEWDAATGQYVLPHKAFTKVFQVRTELQLLDPSESWDFLSWLTTADKLQFYEKAAGVCLFFRLFSLSIDYASGTPIWKKWTTRKKKKKPKEQSMWERLTASTAREFMSKDEKTGKMRDTGVRFKDIAGLNHILVEMREVVKMLLNDPAYAKVGAKVPRGIIFQGPPGTGKTYLARAIAGEAGVTFFSSVGSEFVEMFAGIAAARVNNLFVTARKRAPAIIFIDEIDAIGRARSTLGGDPGSMERESALLAMLVQMDGIHGKLEQVLTIGATNLAEELDQALLRPGRFENVYEIPNPGPVARLEILKYHSRNKKLEDETVLTKVAEVTQGWSAASLANLMNEAAILTVRRSVDKISLGMALELVEGIDWGMRTPKIPSGEAKDRLALVTAAKAVAFALTPGMEKIDVVSMWSRKRGLGPSVEFVPSEKNLDPNWHPEQVDIMDWATNVKVNAAPIGDQPLGNFLHVAGMLVPLYSSRAAELAFFGPDGVSLASAAPLSDCFQIGYYCVRNSMVHPRFKSLPPFHTFVYLGEDPKGNNERDPLAGNIDEELGYHKLTLTLLKASWRRSQKLVSERRTAIVKVAEAMMQAEDERISGDKLVEIIESTPLDDASDIEIQSDFMPILKEVLGRVPRAMAEGEKDAPALDFEDVAAAERRDRAAQGSEGTSEGASYLGSGRPGMATFRGPGSTSFGSSTSSSAEPRGQGEASTSGRAETGAGRPGMTSFRGFGQAGFSGTGPPFFKSPPPSAPSSKSSGAGGGEPSSSSSSGTAPAIQLSDDAIASVARAIMGRLDIVDLVGRNTADEFAERIQEALLDPETVNRLQAVRRWVEQPGAPFPPPPPAKDIPTPSYGTTADSLDAWRQRNVNVITWSAVDMLYNQRQRRYFAQDADLPMGEAPARALLGPKQQQ